MNAISLISKIGSGVAVAAVLGMLSALPAQAGGGNGQMKITHAPTPYRSTPVQSGPTDSKAKTAVTESKPTEFQVAVMAKSPSQPVARRSVFIHR